MPTAEQIDSVRREIGQILECRIGGVHHRLLRVPGHYDYANGDKSRCPICGDVGFPWGGLFHCDGPNKPAHVAVIATGQCFLVGT